MNAEGSSPNGNSSKNLQERGNPSRKGRYIARLKDCLNKLLCRLKEKNYKNNYNYNKIVKG